MDSRTTLNEGERSQSGGICPQTISLPFTFWTFSQMQQPVWNTDRWEVVFQSTVNFATVALNSCEHDSVTRSISGMRQLGMELRQ